MQSILVEIKSLIANKQQQTAIETLLAFLQEGDYKVYEKAKRRVGIPAKAASGPAQVVLPEASLQAFLSELEKKHRILLTFLHAYHQGQAALEMQTWTQAKAHFAKALKLHRGHYVLKRSKLEKYLFLCQKGILMQEQLRQGRGHQKEGNWKKAKESYEAAAKLYQEDFSLSKEKIMRAIAYCEMGQKFEHQLGKARHRLTLENWGEALDAYQEAKQLYRKGFKQDLSMIDYEISLCREAIKSASSVRSAGLLGFVRRNPTALLLGIGALLLCAILWVYVQDYLKTPQVLPSIKANTEVLDPSAPRLAILPFCEQDPALLSISLPLYLDAMKSLQQARGKAFLAIEGKNIQAAMQELGIQQAEACKEENLARISQQLSADQLLIGKIALLPEGKIDLSYQVFESGAIASDPLLELRGTDLADLRMQLRTHMAHLQLRRD